MENLSNSIAKQTRIDLMHDDVTRMKGSMVVVVTLKSNMAEVVQEVGEMIKKRRDL